MKKTITVSVAIAAYNEEEYIGQLLENILSLDSGDYTLEKILVADDCSEDNTAKIISNYSKKYGKIYCLRSDMRSGKIFQLNRLFTENKSDILICLDSDVKIFDKNLINKVVEISKQSSADLLAFHDQPLKASTFAGKVINFLIEIWYEIRNNINKGDSIHNMHGCSYAVSKKYGKTISIPKQVISDDEFIYIDSRLKRMRFYFAKNINVYYKAPDNLKDYLRQATRHQNTYFDIKAYFGPKIDIYYKTPYRLKITAAIKMFVKSPILFIAAICLKLYLTVAKNLTDRDLRISNWDRIKSAYVKN
jgi:glycosyltransferase involved in cell wall biosynthesis